MSTTNASFVSGPLESWRQNVSIRPVLKRMDRHSLHTYFGISPESPDGRQVLTFVSDRPDGQVGDLVMVDREGGGMRTVASGVEVEDSHRQANQQWVCGGRYIAFMSYVGGDWLIERVDTASLKRETLARGRQLGCGQPGSEVIPLYGLHWNPGEHRDLEMLNVRTGEIKTVLHADKVAAEQSKIIDGKLPAGVPRSIFFPTLSPDGRLVYIKLAAVADGQFRSPKASAREGLFVYEIATGRCVLAQDQWGHPAWYSDSRRIQDLQVVLTIGTADAPPQHQQVMHFPRFGGAHASSSPDACLIVSDLRQKEFLPKPQQWTVMLADPRTGEHHFMYVAPVEGDGTRSWRPVHPHPTFTADSRRIYFNVPMGDWTVLHVAERK